MLAVFYDIQLPLGALLLAFVLFQIKHLLADFALQTEWMAPGKNGVNGWTGPFRRYCICYAVEAKARNDRALLIAAAISRPKFNLGCFRCTD